MLNRIVPYPVFRLLWGDRKRFGVRPDRSDPEWKIWLEKAYTDFYQNTQQKGIGRWVGHLAYSVVSKVDFKGKSVLEIGPGQIPHLSYMMAKPRKYVICDVEEECLRVAKIKLDEAGIINETIQLEPGMIPSLPIPNESFDTIICFNTLEHLFPLDDYLNEMKRVLKPGGELVGGIPCEGGLAWGLGRFLTSRHYVHKHYDINYDKIIGWEHPNFVDFVIERLDALFERRHTELHPLSWLPLDLNLVVSFLYARNDLPS